MPTSPHSTLTEGKFIYACGTIEPHGALHISEIYLYTPGSLKQNGAKLRSILFTYFYVFKIEVPEIDRYKRPS